MILFWQILQALRMLGVKVRAYNVKSYQRRIQDLERASAVVRQRALASFQT